MPHLRFASPVLLAATVAVSSFGLTRAADAQQIGTNQIASGLNRSIFITSPAGDSRQFVIQQGGQIELLDGMGGSSTYLDLAGQIESSGNEEGLLGMAFPDNFATTGQFYVNYTAPGSNNSTDTVISRITVADPTASSAGAFTQDEIIRFNQPFGNHNAGWIGFAPGDANGQFLYVPTGDGGAGNDPGNRAQNLGSLLGKVLRLDVSGGGNGYTVPSDNFFAADGDSSTAGEIISYGLRNPYRNSFDRLTGDFYLGDVGQDRREEINFVAGAVGGGSGENFGWRIREGDIDNPNTGGSLGPNDRVDPLFDYSHAQFGDSILNSSGGGSGASTVGGYVYRGDLLPDEFDGLYFFADSTTSQVFTIDPSDPDGTLVDRTAELFPNGALSPYGIVSFGEDADGELYIVGLQQGQVFAIVPEPATLGLLGLGGLALLRRRK